MPDWWDKMQTGLRFRYFRSYDDNLPLKEQVALQVALPHSLQLSTRESFSRREEINDELRDSGWIAPVEKQLQTIAGLRVENVDSRRGRITVREIQSGALTQALDLNEVVSAHRSLDISR